MTRIIVPLVLVVLAAPVWAQDAARGFPIGTTYRAISISGFDVQKHGLTLTVTRAGEAFKGSGHAGCNSWSAVVSLRDDQIDFSNIVTTRKFCGQPRMKTEEAFIASLRSARRWRLDGVRLIIEGETARLLMTSAAQPGRTKSAPRP